MDMSSELQQSESESQTRARDVRNEKKGVVRQPSGGTADLGWKRANLPPLMPR